jgi:signal transduction histidine kinase
VSEDGQQLRVRASVGLEAETAQQVQVPVGAGIAGRIAATRQPLFVPDLSSVDVVSVYLRERIRSLLGVPLLVDDRLLGVLHVGSATPRLFGDDDLHLLRIAANRLALAIEHAQLLAWEQEARAAAERAVRLRDDVLGLAAHDLRAPLTNVRGRAQLIRHRLEGGAAPSPNWLQTQARAIDASVEQLLATIDQLSDIARLHMGFALPLRLEEIDLCALVRAVAEEQATDSSAIEVTVADCAVRMRGDRHQLGRVLQNLIGNALKYSLPGAPVLVEVTAIAQTAVVRIADRGAGIPPDELPQIFTRFFRASTAHGIAGSGIGLYGSKIIVEQHGGRIAIASEVGHGTTVTLEFSIDQGEHHVQPTA